MPEFDYLIVGSGLFGAVFAYEATKIGKKCLVIDKRSHLGGNVFCANIEQINVHQYGAHIFHTNDKKTWDYVNQFCSFNHYVHTVMSCSKGKIYNLPFNMNTFYQLWQTKTPAEAKEIIQKQIQNFQHSNPQNLEEQALNLVGYDIYNTLIKEYTEKQWGCKATDLPSFIIKRLPIRFTYDNRYFNDKYQGIPIGGYNTIINKLLCNIPTLINVDYFKHRDEFNMKAQKIVFTGKIDEFYNYKFGELMYRSLRFENEVIETENYQGCPVLNYNDADIPYTRIIEHKHFEFGTQKRTVITKEFPQTSTKTNEAYYPINDKHNNDLYNKYASLALSEENVIFGGRLAEYKYYDMHQIVASALTTANKELKIH